MSAKAKSCEELNDRNSDFKVLSPALQRSVRNIIEKVNFTDYDVTVKDLNTNGNNHLAKLYEMNIKCTTHECEDINIFVKEKIPMKNLTILSAKQVYANEELVYKDFSEIIRNLQDQANVPPEERFKTAKAYDETNNDAIIIENLSQKGFKTYGKVEPVSLKFFELGVKELAKLHALSFVIENKLPQYFKENLAVLDNPLIFNEEWNGLITDTCIYIANMYDGETKTKMEKYSPVLLEKLPRYLKDKTNVCAISHGDYKKNNIMVRFMDGEPVEVVPFDYQFFDYGCPMRDLLYFIFTSTDQEFRKKHLKDIKELYFETLSQFLQYFDMDVEAVYPREEFEKLYTEWLDYGLMMTLAFALATFGLDAEFDLDNKTIAEIPVSLDKKSHYIFRGLIDDFVQWGYL